MQPLLIIGAGGHGRVCADLANLLGHSVLGFLDSNPALIGVCMEGTRVLGGDDTLAQYTPSGVTLLNGIGSVALPTMREKIYTRLQGSGYKFLSLYHPHVSLAQSAIVGKGVQVMAGAIIQSGCRIDENTIINSGAIIEHDSHISAHCHVAPRAVICGKVFVGTGCHIGVGAVVVQGVSIGANSFVAAGAVVVADIPSGARFAGLPARQMKDG